MKLSQIQFQNFKSYSGVLTLGPFNQKITCIIGPNGSGKSNFIDGILFVLGSRSKELRQTCLQELIYKFDQEGKINARRSCKVTLTFILSNDSVITVARSVISIKNTSSRYYWNEQVVTYDEIIANILEYGIDLKNGNFIMMQGQVESLSTSSPFQLLEFLERVSGSFKYIEGINVKTQKRTQLQGQLNILLTRQSKQGRDLKEAKISCLKVLEWLYYLRKLYQCNVHYFRAISDEITKKIKTQNDQIVILKNEMQYKTATQLKKVKDVDKQLEITRNQLVQLTGQKNNLERSIKTSEEQILKKENSLKYSIADCIEIREKRIAQEKSLEEYLKEDHSVNDYKSQMKQLQKQINSQFTDKKRSQLNKVLDLNVSRQNKQNMKNKLIQDRQNLQNALNKHQQDLNLNFPSQIFKLKQKRQKLKQQIQKKQEHKQSLQDSNKSIDINLNTKTQQSTAYKNQKKIMEAIYNKQIKGITGKLRDHCEIDKQYETALKYACSHLNFYVANTKEDSQKLIDYVVKFNLGRVDVLIRQIIDTSSMRAKMNQKYQKSHHQRLFDLVVSKHHSDDFRIFAYWSLGDTLVARNLTDAISISYGQNRPTGIRTVTYDGCIISESGIMTKPATNNTSNEYELEQMKEKNQKDIEQILLVLQQKNIQLSDIESKMIQKQSQVKSIKLLTPQNIKNIRQEMITISNQIKQIEISIQIIDLELKRCKYLDRELRILEKYNFDIYYLKQKIRQKDPKIVIKQFEDRIKSFQEKESNLQKCCKKSQQKYEQSIQSLTSKKNHIQELEEKIKDTQATIKGLVLKRNMHQKEYEHSRNDKEKQQTIRQLQKQIKQIQLQLTNQTEKLEELKQKVMKYEKYQICQKILSQNQDIDLLWQVKAKSLQQITHMMKQFQDKLEKTPQNKLDFKSIAKYHQLQKIYQQTQLQFNEKDAQRKRIVIQISIEQRKRKNTFNDAFDKIADQTKRIFNHISSRGDINLYPLNVADPFNQGVQLKAKPAGKPKFMKMNLLSGGEKTMASLALIFACNLVMKCPFYIVDEIDAALDSSKTECIANFIKDEIDSQFIIISLRHQTYTKANTMVSIWKIGHATMGKASNIDQTRERFLRYLKEKKNSTLYKDIQDETGTRSSSKLYRK